MKKYKLVLSVFIFVTFFVLVGFYSRSAIALVAGCNSIYGYNSTNGEPCAIEPAPPILTCNSFGIDSVSGFICGCNSRSGYSSIDGRSCTGCDSESGYNLLTGASCAPISISYPLSITTASQLPNAKVGQPYLATLNTSGIPPSNGYNWSVDSNFPKIGFSFGPSYGNSIRITGTPSKIYVDGVEQTTPKTFSFFVTVSSGSDSTTKEFSLTVNPDTASTCSSLGIDTVTGFACGCDSRSGYSSTTGISCSGCNGTTGYNLFTGASCAPTPPSTPVCTNGFDSETGWRCGCTSGYGWSSTTGQSCRVETFPSGCTSIYGYSSKTGEPCSGNAISIPTPTRIPTIVPTYTPSSSCTIVSTLRLGSIGADVACLQQRIGLISDGKFGRRTLIAVQAFQMNAGLRADGVVGPKSIAALEVDN